MEKQYAFYFDSSRCSGCKTCQIACKDKNDLELGVLWRRVYEVSSGEWTNENGVWKNNVSAYNLSIACNHCENPICAEVCPTTAMHKDENGIVSVDSNKCIGCKYCEWSCPYGAPQFDEKKGVMSKCNLCMDYVIDNKNPSCVDACPMRVLDFGEYEKIKAKYGNESEVFPLPKSEITKPCIVISPHKDKIDVEDIEAAILNNEEVKVEK